MKIHRGFENLPEIMNPVVAIGSFDGVHRGHRLLIEQLRELAVHKGGESVVVTFDPHPRQVLKGDNRLLSTIEEKLILLAETDVDNVVVVEFTREFSMMSHTEFIEEYIIGKLKTKVLITGQEHNFGHNRSGNANSAREYGIETRQLERYDNISSTQIRQAIEAGKMRDAAKLLGGQGYLISTPVVDQSKLLPPEGMYCVDMDGKKLEIEISRKQLSNIKKNITVLYEVKN